LDVFINSQEFYYDARIHERQTKQLSASREGISPEIVTA